MSWVLYMYMHVVHMILNCMLINSELEISQSQLSTAVMPTLCSVVFAVIEELVLCSLVPQAPPSLKKKLGGT